MNSCFAAERYDVTPLPFIPFSSTGGEALNNNGVVAGGIANSDGSGGRRSDRLRRPTWRNRSVEARTERAPISVYDLHQIARMQLYKKMADLIPDPKLRSYCERVRMLRRPCQSKHCLSLWVAT